MEQVITHPQGHSLTLGHYNCRQWTDVGLSMDHRHCPWPTPKLHGEMSYTVAFPVGCHFLYTGYRTQSHPDRAASTVHYYSSSYRTATLSLMQICYKYATLPVWKHCRYIRTSVSCLQCDIAHKVTTNSPWSLHCKR